MSEPWKHRIAASVESPEAAVRPMGWEEAQPWCNFVLMRPGDLPAGLTLGRAEMRPEAPPGRHPGMDPYGRFEHGISNRASYRFEVVGQGRRLQVKQFFYDLGPPAFDHPSFWLNAGRPFPVGDHIGWLGVDFHDLKAASLSVDRTMIEVSVLEGGSCDEELMALCRGLRPAVPPARRSILETPIADQFYQGRYPDLVVTVPMGFWAHRRRPASLRTTVLRADDVPGSLAGLRVAPPPGYGFTLGAALVFGDPGQPQEVEWVYEGAARPGHYVRILTWPSGAAGGLGFPPERDRQPCSTRTVEVHGRPVYHAFVDERFGPHEAVWQAGGLTVMALVKAAPWMDMGWSQELFERMVGAHG